MDAKNGIHLTWTRSGQVMWIGVEFFLVLNEVEGIDQQKDR